MCLVSFTRDDLPSRIIDLVVLLEPPRNPSLVAHLSIATCPVRVCQGCIVADEVFTRNALALLISNLSSAQFEHS